MVGVFSVRTALFPLMLLSLARQFAKGHSWIDCLDTNLTKIYDESASYIYGGSEGNGFCEGYAAGYQGRGRNTIGTEYTYKILKNEVEAGAPICEDVGPTPYKDWCTRLVAPPEVKIHFAYLPNGHIVKDKKAVGTQHGIYWTGQVGTSLTTTHDMIPENLVTGTTMDFDDGNCGETVDIHGNPSGRAGDGKPCIGSFTIPKGSPPGIYKMVWYWEFWLDNPEAYKDPTLARGYFGAAYTSCFEVEVISGGDGGNGSTISDAGTQVEMTGSLDAPTAHEPVAAAQADQPASPPPPSATLESTPQSDSESASMGSGAENAPSNAPPLPEAGTPGSTTLVSEPAQTDMPQGATPDSMTPAPEPAPSNAPPLPEAATPGSTAPVPGPASTNTPLLPEAATPGSTAPVPGPASTNTPLLPEAATPGSTAPVPEPAETDMPEGATPDSKLPVPEQSEMDMPEEETSDSKIPVSEPNPMNTREAATSDSTTPVPKAKMPAPAAQMSVEPPAAPTAPPVVPKPSPEVPAPPIPSNKGCRARVRSSVAMDW